MGLAIDAGEHQAGAEIAPDVRGAVLLVDDEPTVRHVVRRMLEREGIQVMTACNGQEAVELYRSDAERISLVLMDLTMPEMDGEQAFHAIRAVNPAATIVLSSGFSESDAVDRLHHCGLAGFIRKPYTRQLLLSEIVRLGVSRPDDSPEQQQDLAG